MIIIITLSNLNNLNVSLQVGDIIYATPINTQMGANDPENSGAPVGENFVVGKLLNINNLGGGTFELTIDQDPIDPVTGASIFSSTYIPNVTSTSVAGTTLGDFLMFSKSRNKRGLGGNVNGYYAKANFVNNSREKAELFAVSSEITINSK